MDRPNQHVGSPSARVTATLRLIIRPLVRFLLHQGITYPLLTDFLKATYVDVARAEFLPERRRPTDSGISRLTGVPRKDVKCLSGRERSSDSPPSNVSLGAALVARWVSDPDYLDRDGRPIPLARLASQGGRKSFEALVSGISKDIRSRVVLDEWLSLGVARLDTEDFVCLKVAAFVPEHGFNEKLYYFGQNVHDHMAGAVHNLAGLLPPFLERSVYYDQLASESIDELRRLSASLGTEALQAINRRAIELERRDMGRPQLISFRMNFGIYFYTDGSG